MNREADRLSAVRRVSNGGWGGRARRRSEPAGRPFPRKKVGRERRASHISAIHAARRPRRRKTQVRFWLHARLRSLRRDRGRRAGAIVMDDWITVNVTVEN